MAGGFVCWSSLMWFLSIELHSIAVFIDYKYVSIWSIKFVYPLTTRISVFSSSPTRRPWCSNSSSVLATLSIMAFNICERADLKVLFKLFGNTLLRFVSLENFTKATTFSNSNLIGKFHVNDNKEKVLTLSLSEVACSSHFATAPCQLQTLCFHQQDG